MKKLGHIIANIVHFYYDGFRAMTIGRVLWCLILIKLFIIFVILRLVFFRPVLSGLNIQQKETIVARTLIDKGAP